MGYVNKMTRLVGLVLVLTAGCFAQQQQTLYQTVATGRVTTGAIAITRNIGQNFHLLAIAAYSVDPATCSTITGTFAMQGSFDNTNWLTFRETSINTVSGTAGATTSVFTGQGSYPYLRVNVIDLTNTATCGVNIYYSGNISGPTDSSNYSIKHENFRYVAGTTTVSGTANLLGQCLGSMITAVYGAVVINQNAAALASGAKLYTFSSDLVENLVLPLRGVGANATLVLPQGARPYGTTLQGSATTNDLYIDPGAAGDVSYAVVYRCE